MRLPRECYQMQQVIETHPPHGFAQRIFFNSDSLCRIYLFGILEVDGVRFPSRLCQVDGRVKGEPAIPCPGDGGFGEV